MSTTPFGARRRHYRTLWISDVHLGFKGCRAETLLAFLRAVDCDALYLVGDIFDIWAMRRRPFWPAEHGEVVREVLAKARAGTRVVYVPGNHDELLRDFVGHCFGNVAIEARAVHVRVDGSRLLVLHGDEFDAAVTSSRWIGMLGSHAYGVLLSLNRVVNGARRHFGFPYWSLASYLKHKVKNAVKAISNFEHAVARAAHANGVAGVVCGHIHRAEIATIEGVLYCNCGDWVESLTALAEHPDGRLEIVPAASVIDAPQPAAAGLPAAA